MFVNPAQIPGFLKSIHLFGRLDEQQLALMAEHMEQILVEKDRLVYEIGSDALNFYFVYSGRIKLERAVSEYDNYDAEIVPGDFFSLESISGEPYHLTSAKAIEDSIVLKISGEQLDVVSRDIPELRDRLDLAVRSFQMMWNVALEWREPGEAIYYYARRHIIYMFIRMIAPLIFALIALAAFLIAEIGMQGAMVFPLAIAAVSALIAVGWGLWSYFDWSNDFFVITDRRVVVFEKVILMFDSRMETPMEAVLAVNQRTTWLGRILGYGDVTVKSFTGTLMMSFLDAPQEVQQMIEYLLLRARSRKSSQEMRAISRTIKERLSKNRQQVVQAAKPRAAAAAADEEEEELEPVEYKPGPFRRFMTNFLHLRLEENGVIIYRKFWLILLEQAWAPTLILLALLLLNVLRIANVIRLFPLGAFLGVTFSLGIIATLWWGYEYWDWTNDVYIITSEQLIDVDKRPLGTETRKAAPLKNILSIEYQRLGVLGYIFNFGTVFIKVGETTFTFDYVHDPRQVQRELFQRFSEVKERERQQQEQAEQKRMADWIEGYHRWQQEEGTQGNPPPASPEPYPR